MAQLPTTPQPISIFDGHHPPDPNDIDDCVHCGFCLPTCPTFVLWGEEMDTPRGRIYLMKLGTEGAISFNDTFVRHMDHCLGCMACLSSCPSGVQYDRLIEATRAQVERHAGRTPGDRAFRELIFGLFPYAGRLRVLAWPLWAFQRLGLQALLRRSGVLRWLPERLRALEALMPPLSIARLRAQVPPRLAAHGAPRLRVGLLLGCVQRAFFGDVNAATARVLAAEGCEVLAPPDQACCGALMVHAGRDDDARAFARRQIAAWERVPVDVIAINAAGCGSTLKEYGHLLRDDPAYAERARAFAARCRDITELLAELEPRAPRHPLPLTVAYHDACHLQHAQGIRRQPRSVLASIPGLQVREIADAAICCGSAGIYNLVEPGPAQQLGDRKARHILDLEVSGLVSANPGCSLQIRSALARAGRELPTIHPVELLDASIRGVHPWR
jgi:glycolate oxidase iron-sulfur subunit